MLRIKVQGVSYVHVWHVGHIGKTKYPYTTFVCTLLGRQQFWRSVWRIISWSIWGKYTVKMGGRFNCLGLCQISGVSISGVSLADPVVKWLVSDSLSLTDIKRQIQACTFNQVEQDTVYKVRAFTEYLNTGCSIQHVT